MNVSVEISFYPLLSEYLLPIRDFINRLNKQTTFKIQTSGMSTYIFGDFKEVMKMLTDEMLVSFEIPHSVFILKIVNSDLFPND